MDERGLSITFRCLKCNSELIKRLTLRQVSPDEFPKEDPDWHELHCPRCRLTGRLSSEQISGLLADWIKKRTYPPIKLRTAP